jgi:hypothetical protein
MAEIIKLWVDPLEVASMEKIGIRRIKTAHFWVIRRGVSRVIAWVSITESIRQQQIDQITLLRQTNTRAEKRFLSKRN